MAYTIYADGNILCAAELNDNGAIVLAGAGQTLALGCGAGLNCSSNIRSRNFRTCLGLNGVYHSAHFNDALSCMIMASQCIIDTFAFSCTDLLTTSPYCNYICFGTNDDETCKELCTDGTNLKACHVKSGTTSNPTNIVINQAYANADHYVIDVQELFACRGSSSGCSNMCISVGDIVVFFCNFSNPTRGFTHGACCYELCKTALNCYDIYHDGVCQGNCNAEAYNVRVNVSAATNSGTARSCMDFNELTACNAKAFFDSTALCFPYKPNMMHVSVVEGIPFSIFGTTPVPASCPQECFFYDIVCSNGTVFCCCAQAGVVIDTTGMADCNPCVCIYKCQSLTYQPGQDICGYTVFTSE